MKGQTEAFGVLLVDAEFTFLRRHVATIVDKGRNGRRNGAAQDNL
jgi:hypothetical protein